MIVDAPHTVGVVVTVVRGPFACQALYVGPRDTETSADARRFIDSLALVGP